jgi:hypothetical protein
MSNKESDNINSEKEIIIPCLGCGKKATIYWKLMDEWFCPICYDYKTDIVLDKIYGLPINKEE